MSLPHSSAFKTVQETFANTTCHTESFDENDKMAMQRLLGRPARACTKLILPTPA